MNSRPSIFEKVMKGVRAGTVPGVIIGILSFLGNYFLAIKYRDEISGALGKPYTPSMQGLIMFSVASAIMLTICGILYTLSYNKLPVLCPSGKHFLLG